MNTRNGLPVCRPERLRDVTTSHESTGFTPNYLMYGRQVLGPVDLMLGEKPAEKLDSFDTYVDALQDRLYKAYSSTRWVLKKHAEANKRKYDVRVCPKQYQVGDLVRVFNPRHLTGKQNKWARKYEGPYEVSKLMGEVNLLI